MTPGLSPLLVRSGGSSAPPPDELFRILAENLPGVVYLCANDERYTMHYLSRAVEDLVGIPAGEFLADRRSFTELFHPEDAPRIPLEVAEALAARRPFSLSYRLRHARGGWVWVEEYGQGVFDREGRLRFLEGVIFDVSERVAAAEALARGREDLERRVVARTAELEAANARLQDEQHALWALLEQQERERRLTACEIHDGFVQYAVGALMRLEALRARAAPSDATVRELEDTIRLLQRGVADARRMIAGLRPRELDEAGLVAALAQLASDFAAADGPNVVLHVEPGFPRLPPASETTLFRLAQEALSNVRRHSGARRVELRLRRRDDRLRLEVQDDGGGFDPAAVGGASFGLRGMRERAEALGGGLTVETAPGRGTLVAAEIPAV